MGKVDGVEFKGGTANDYAFLMGKKQMLEEFETAILGMKVNDVKESILRFPDNYNPDLAGKEAIFTITLKKIETKILPQINEQFIKLVGVESGNPQDLFNDIKENLNREVGRRTFALLKDQVFNFLLEHHKFDIPKSILENNDTNSENDQPLKDDQVRLGLIVSKIVADNNIEPTNEEIREEIMTFASNYEDPAEVVRWYAKTPEKMQEMYSYVLENKVVKFISNQANVQDKNISFEELSQQKIS